jgi:hypothetical protein
MYFSQNETAQAREHRLNNRARTLKLLDATWETLGEAHRSLIQSAEAQVGAFDEIFFTTINQAAKYNPQKIEIAHPGCAPRGRTTTR